MRKSNIIAYRNTAARREKAIMKELVAVEKQEKRLEQSAVKPKPASWKDGLESKIPPKVYSGLESAFCKGFMVVFSQGKAVIEKGFNKEEIKANYKIHDYAVQIKGGRKELKLMRKGGDQSVFLNLVATTIEGIGLGALGIGMPDIVLFLGMLLKGIYEMALNFGFDYETPPERMLILKMMATALSSGDDWLQRNAEVERLLISETSEISEQMLENQMKETASVFAMDMLLLKFIQGLPIIGILGGAANPVYYNKVMKYVELKYRKRYLQMQQKRGCDA